MTPVQTSQEHLCFQMQDWRGGGNDQAQLRVTAVAVQGLLVAPPRVHALLDEALTGNPVNVQIPVTLVLSYSSSGVPCQASKVLVNLTMRLVLPLSYTDPRAERT